MKKINKINISDKNNKMNWHIKLMFIFLFCTLVVMLAALIKFYYDVNKENNQAYLDSNIITDLSTDKTNYKIIRNDDGMLGIVDSEGRSVIEPQWDNIYILNSNRFAVQKKINDVLKMGIIDSDENYITPFIYTKFISVDNDYLIGYFENETGFSVFDTCGNLITDKKWLKYQYDKDNKKLTLSNDSGDYIFLNDNNKIICSEIKFSRKIKSEINITFDVNNAELIEQTNSDDLFDIFNIMCTYFEALTSNNMEEIKKITNDQYYSSLSLNNFFNNCKIKNISNVKIEKFISEECTYILSVEVIYDYKNHEKNIKNLKSLLSLTVIKDGDSMILKSINKEEL
ncbi:MAG: WG repeat-containing protein [Oscillospiraceae bacterium]